MVEVKQTRRQIRGDADKRANPPTPWGHRRVLLLSFHLSLSSLTSLFLPQTPSWWAQETPEGWVVRAQRTSHKSYDAPSLAQPRLRTNPHGWLAYKRLPDPPWKHFAKHKVRWDSQTCCKIPMRICSFWFKGCSTSHMMHQALRSKGYLPI